MPSEIPARVEGGWRALLVLCALAVPSGIAIGLVGGLFRWALGVATDTSTGLASWAHGLGWAGALIPVLATAVASALAALIVRAVPLASGSGIPHVEAVERRQAPLPPLLVVPARFIGGVLSIGSGLVLGREGPTVHMGAALGATSARLAGLDDARSRTLTSALSGAGLAVAFNAPIAGALFTLEEVARSFRVRLLLPTLIAVAVAIGCARLITGDRPDFAVGAVEDPPLWTVPIVVVFGVLAGLIGVLYNRALLGVFDLFARFSTIPGEAKAAVVGGVVGLVLFIDPLAVGGGDAIAQLILTGRSFALPAVLGYLVVRFALGPLSYASGAPGGIFAPVLALGALLGVAYADVVSAAIPAVGEGFGVAMAIVGMSTLLTAVVRAPLTGIVIVIEMTAITTVTIPMLVAGAAAILTTMALHSTPVYDSLRVRMLSPGGRPPS